MTDLLRAISEDGVSSFLIGLASSRESRLHRTTLEKSLTLEGVSYAAQTLDNLLNLRLIHPIGARLTISRLGHRTALLLEALDGGDIEDVIRRLRRLDGFAELYELVRQGMTTRFLTTLIERPLF